MEQYLQYVNALRSQMNDVENEAANASMEEHTLVATIKAMENDLNSVKAEREQLNEDLVKISTAEAQICSQMLEKQKKLASLELDSSTLTQTLELMKQERVCLSTKLAEKRSYYAGVADDIIKQLRQQEDWFDAQRTNGETGKHEMGNDDDEELTGKLESEKCKLKDITRMKNKLITKNTKMKQSIEQMICRVNDSMPELMKMDTKSLEEEYNGFLSDKAGEVEYFHSLEQQIKKLKDVSHNVKCTCGSEYRVAMDLCE
ncbi:hypothetical protein LINPERHAP1_LOCUS36667 [Linum perenne]